MPQSDKKEKNILMRYAEWAEWQVSGTSAWRWHCCCLQPCSSAGCWHLFWLESGSSRLPYLHGLLLPTSSTASYPEVAGLRLVGYTRLCRCEFSDRLLKHCSYWCTKDSYGQATACVERGCARRHRHSEVRSRPGSITARRASLAWRPRSGVLQAGSDSSPMSERPRSTVPLGLLCPGRRCWHSATAAFQQPATSCSTTLPAQYLWLRGLFSRRPHSLEFSHGFYPGPDHQCRLFQTPA